MSRSPSEARRFLQDPLATDQFARTLAEVLPSGSCLLLSGPIGAGKSSFARAFIRHRLGYSGDIPSPSFTLVQTYRGTNGSSPEEIWHADLYRLSHPDEVTELGLLDAMAEGATLLVEWPERAGAIWPEASVGLDFSLKGEGRDVVMSGLPHEVHL